MSRVFLTVPFGFGEAASKLNSRVNATVLRELVASCTRVVLCIKLREVSSPPVTSRLIASVRLCQAASRKPRAQHPTSPLLCLQARYRALLHAHAAL